MQKHETSKVASPEGQCSVKTLVQNKEKSIMVRRDGACYVQQKLTKGAKSLQFSNICVLTLRKLDLTGSLHCN